MKKSVLAMIFAFKSSKTPHGSLPRPRHAYHSIGSLSASVADWIKESAEVANRSVRRPSGPSDPLELPPRQFAVLGGAGVEGGGRLEEEDVDLFLGHGPVLDAA